MGGGKKSHALHLNLEGDWRVWHYLFASVFGISGGLQTGLVAGDILGQVFRGCAVCLLCFFYCWAHCLRWRRAW